MQTKDGNDLPLGFGMALMQNPRAYIRFAEMSGDEQRQLINAAHGVESSVEMREMIDRIGGDTGAKM